MIFYPHFKLFYFDDRLEFSELFELKTKRINNADLFSQPTFLIFTKSDNISGGRCMYVYIYYIYIVYTVYLYIYIYIYIYIY